MEQKVKAFTAEYSGCVSELATVCQIDLPYGVETVKSSVTSQSFSALWDTGAMCSVISKNVIEKLGLSPIGSATVYHANGVSETFSYLVSVHLPCGIKFPYVRVTEGILSVCDVLIGMDII
ncbi:MAG: retroviral-like aspartic protease family protein, partial [Paludibacter sp.]|nr:retroviral-like aspartic protease family protein [Paludibacter sp.]